MPMLDRKKCFALWDKYNVPDNVRAHSLQVERVAVLLAKKLNDNSVRVNVEKVSAGALLHDIGKIVSIEQGKRENIVSKRILEEEGFPEIARIAEMHIVSKILEPDFKECNLEEKIVYYADKRVRHDKIVSVRERIRDLAERYYQSAETINQCLQNILWLEKELFSKAKTKTDLSEIK